MSVGSFWLIRWSKKWSFCSVIELLGLFFCTYQIQMHTMVVLSAHDRLHVHSAIQRPGGNHPHWLLLGERRLRRLRRTRLGHARRRYNMTVNSIPIHPWHSASFCTSSSRITVYFASPFFSPYNVVVLNTKHMLVFRILTAKRHSTRHDYSACGSPASCRV